MAQSDAMLRYAGTLATANGVPLYPPGQMLAVEEALGLVSDLQRDWRPPVGISLAPELYGRWRMLPGVCPGALPDRAMVRFLGTWERLGCDLASPLGVWHPKNEQNLTNFNYFGPTNFTGHAGTPELPATVKRVRENFMRESFPKYMGFLTTKLTSSAFLAGPTPTIADCALVPILNRFTSGGVDHVPVDCLEPFPIVRGYVGRFMALEPVQAWYAKAE
jgi:glutathione S-transferase